MKKDEILNASRKEHRNKDLAEMEVVYQAQKITAKANNTLKHQLCLRDFRLDIPLPFQHYCNTMVSSFYQNEAKERFGLDCSVFCVFHFGICWIC